MLDRIPTRMAISNRGMELNDIMCPICGVEPENGVHIFSRCNVARSVWELVFRWLQLAKEGDFNPREMFCWLEDYRASANKKAVIEVVVCTVYWVLWRFRNDMVHGAGKMKRNILFVL